MNARLKLGLVTLGVAVLGLSACGSDSLAGPAASSGPSVSVSADADLKSLLPQDIQDAGVIVVGTDASYAPSEFLAADGKTVQGFDVDVFNAVAAKLGVTAEFQPADFGSIITGVSGGRYDVGVSSFTITDARKAEANMVSYFSAGTQWATATGNPEGVDPDNPCGKTIAVQSDTVQDDEMSERQKDCGDTAIDLLKFSGQDQATAAVVSGRADAMLADSPVTAYAVQQAGGKLEALGDIYDSAPYGIVVPQAETQFADAIQQALAATAADGSYAAALQKWGVEQGAIDDFAVNP